MRFRVWLILLVGWFGGAGVAAAQPYLPRVTAASLGSAATRAPGDTLLVNFTLAPGTPASTVAFYFQNGTYKARAVSTNSPGGGAASAVVGSDWPNGTYHLVEIDVTDGIGREVDYNANGGVTFTSAPWLSPAPGSAPTAAALDFNVTGGVGTVVLPAITNLTRTSADSLAAGSPVTFNVSVTPGSSPNWTVTLSLLSPDSHIITQSAASATQATFSFPTSAEWLNGTYRVVSITAYDANGVTSYTRGDTTHILPTTTDFQLTGGVASVVAPDVTTIGRSSPATVTVGNAVTMTFNVTPGTSAVASVTFNFGGPGGMTRTLTTTNIAGGTVSTTVTSDWLTGPFTLNSVSATDVLGRSVSYSRNSAIIVGHTLPFSNLDFQVTGALTIPPSFSNQPQGGTVQPGQTLTLSATVNSVVGVSAYQWYVGQPGDTSTPVTSGNGSQYTPQPPASSTTYWLRATTPYGTIDSAAATIAVAYPSPQPAVITQPAAADHLVNNGVTLSAFVVGPPPLAYQWFKDGVAVPGATATSLSLIPGQLGDSGTYVLKITNPNGTASTNPASVVFEDTPQIVVQPSNQSAKVGDSVTLTVTATGGNLRYGWLLNGYTPIPGATSSGNTLTIASVQQENAGSYQVQILNQAGSVTSAAAVLTVTGGSPPTMHVASAIIAPLNQSFGYEVSVAGSNISGYAASGLPPGLVIDPNTGNISGTPTTAGTFPATISATNAGGTSTANTSFIVSSGPVPPVITRQPVSQTAVLHTSVTFTAEATTGGFLDTQWNFNGQPIAGERGSSLTVAVTSAAQAGDYTVDYTGSAGVTRSAAAHLTVDAAHSAPYLTSSSGDQTVTAGTTATLSASFDGTPPFTVQWYRYNTAIPGATSANYTVANASTQDTAQYFATITNAYGSISTSTQTLLVNYVATPSSQTVGAGSTANISVPASSAVVSYRWYEGKSGDTSKPVAGATGPTLTTPPLTQTTSYWAWVTSADKFAFSSTATVTVTPPVSTAYLTNISVRGNAGTADQRLIVGFVVTGAGNKQMLVRGIGPTLADFHLSTFLPDPQLVLFAANGQQLAANDDWGGDPSFVAAFNQTGAFALPANSKDAALLQALPAGAYTAHLVAGSGSGVGLLEAFDVTGLASSARLANFSVRSNAGAGEQTLIAGFVIAGDGPRQVLIRGIGPSLAQFGVTGALADPQLAVYDGSRVIAQNNDWAGDPALASAFTQVGAFALSPTSTDAAVLVTLLPGAYTVQVTGAAGTTGVALIEVYEMR